MLRQVHFYMKGGKLPFAAVCTEVRIADKAAICRMKLNGRIQVAATARLSRLQRLSRAQVIVFVEVAIAKGITAIATVEVSGSKSGLNLWDIRLNRLG